MEHDFTDFATPHTDDRAAWNIILWTIGTPALTVAHQLKLFPLLDEGPRTEQEICSALGIAPRGARAILSLCASAGLVRRDGEHWALTQPAADYLVEGKPTYFGRFIDFAVVANERLYALETVRRAATTGNAQVYGSGELFKTNEEQAALMRGFTEMMHGHSIPSALAWPDELDLSKNRLLLDVGGGSGAHSIGAVRRWPNLSAVVFDAPAVCQVASEFAARYGFADRIATRPGDMWTDPFPAADVHFYADIFHDWPAEKCRFLTRKSFEALEPGGRLILHEMLYNDDKTGPFATAVYSIAMLLWTEGQQFSRKELCEMLAEAGFRDVEAKPTFGHFSIVTGRKP
jgi:cyclopropane fatty-acyl-phospholipid synthase-like methyltransferase